MKILLLEDEKELSASITRNITEAGLLCECAETLSKAIEKVSLFQYDLVIVDINLPDGNGLQLLPEIIKHQQNAGILILSAKNSLEDKLLGLDFGADDYLTKPFHFAELLSRINSILRRRKFNGSSLVNFEEIKIDTSSKEVFVHEFKIDLTKKEFELLVFFVTNQNRVLTKESIAEHIWGDYIDMADNFDFVYTHIKNLRKKIEDKKGTNYLKTVYGVGYKFTCL